MGMKSVRWCDIVDEVRYWDAVDLLRNLDDELERAGRGLANCVFHPGHEYPYAGAGRGKILLKPEISKKDDHVEIDFPNLKHVRREDIDVEIEDRELRINVRKEKPDKGEVLGWFRMEIPEEFDAETCHAEHSEGKLKICLRKRKARPARRRITIT
jgi:HSP20 family molecular chaperone IbpA